MSKSGSNSSRKGAGDGWNGGSHISGSSNGDNGNGVGNAAAMAAVMAVPTWRWQWQRGWPMWAEVIFCTYFYLHNSRVLTYVITIVRLMAKHKSVLRQNTFKTLLKSVLPKQKVFWKNSKCFQFVGTICWKHFRNDTNFLKNEIGFSNIGDLKNRESCQFFFVRHQYCPPFFSQSSISQCWQFTNTGQVASIGMVTTLVKSHS